MTTETAQPLPIRADNTIRAVAIADMSDVRSVLVRPKGATAFHELHEARPQTLQMMGAQEIELQRLDWTGGELVLRMMRQSHALHRLSPIRMFSSIEFDANSDSPVRTTFRAHIAKQRMGLLRWCLRIYNDSISGRLVEIIGGVLRHAGDQDEAYSPESDRAGRYDTDLDMTLLSSTAIDAASTDLFDGTISAAIDFVEMTVETGLSGRLTLG